MLSLVISHLLDDLFDRHSADTLVLDRPREHRVPSVKQRLDIAARGLHAVDHLWDGQALRKNWVIVVDGGCAGTVRLIFDERTRSPLGVDAFDPQQVREMRCDVPCITTRDEAELLFAKTADRGEQPLAAIAQARPQLFGGHPCRHWYTVGGN